MVLADDVVMCGGNPIYMTAYLESWRKALEESIYQKTQWMHVSSSKRIECNF